MDLSDLVLRSGVKSLAVVGTAKNVGKTVTMNYVASELSARGLTVALVSSGRDGETADSFTGEPKPSVIPPEGSWVATAEGVLGESAGTLEIADVSERAGLLGRVVIGRVRETAPIELVGPQSVKELSSVVTRMHEFGADIVLVDGALDRVAAANPAVTGGVVLATGAAADSNLALIAEFAAFIAWLWSRKRPANPEVRELAHGVLEDGVCAFLDAAGPGYRVRPTPFRTVLGREDDILSQVKSAAFAVVPGAVSHGFLSAARDWAEREDFAVIAKNPVNLFSRSMPGVPVFVDEEMNLIAITVNPVSPLGISYDPGEMVGEVSRQVLQRTGARVPVYDVVSGISNMEGVAALALG